MTKQELNKLIQVFRKRFGGKVEAEAVNGSGRYRLAVVSPKFAKMSHLERQDALWDVVDATLSRGATLDVSLILAFAPKDLKRK